MTNNAILAFNAKEIQRHNLVSERQNFLNLKENARHNRVYEAITQQGNYLNYGASIYNANMHYKGVKYSADSNARTSMNIARVNAANQYAIASLNARTTLESSRLQAKTNIKTTQINANTSKYVANVQKVSNMYATNQSARVQLANIANQYKMNAATNQTTLISTGMRILGGNISSGISAAAKLI